MTAKFHMGGSDPGIGDGRAEVGSEQWARRMRADLVTLSADMPKVPKYLAVTLRSLREREGWKLLTDKANRPFTSLEEFCEAKRPWGLNMKLADLERWLDRTGPAGAPMYWNPDNGEEVEVHPAATHLPKLNEAELSALAADIKANGLQHPVVLWEGKIIDGRNRLAACQLADVEPTFTELTHCPDPVAYVMSANVRRRNMSKAARAFGAARMKAHYMARTKASQVAAGTHGAKGGRGKKKGDQTLAGQTPEGFEWYDLAALDWQIGADLIKYAAAILTCDDDALTKAVEADETVTLTAGAKLARAIDGKRLTRGEVHEAIAAGTTTDLLKSLVEPRGQKSRADKGKSAAPSVADALEEKIAAAPNASAIEAIVGEVDKANAAGKLSDPDNRRLEGAVRARVEKLTQPPASTSEPITSPQPETPAPAPSTPPQPITPAPPPAPPSGQTAFELDAPATPEAPDAPSDPAPDATRRKLLQRIEAALATCTRVAGERADRALNAVLADLLANQVDL